MAKVISSEDVRDVSERLADMERPEKKRYTRKEAVCAWKSIIQKRLKEGWSFEELAEAIREASQGELNYRPKELEGFFMSAKPARPKRAGGERGDTREANR